MSHGGVVDLRSDTVTRPTDAMRRAMADAEVDDDVLDHDPTVRRLEELAAGLAGTEAAMFGPSATQANLCAVMSHCQRGDEMIVGHDAHTYRWEAGGAAVLASVQPQPVRFRPDSTLDLDEVAAQIKPDDPHFARTRLLCLENTHHGDVVPLDYLARAAAFTAERGLGLHLDGARVANAAVALGVPISATTEGVDTASICLSKGLGAPMGAVLCGSAELIARARRHRKILGGGLRQSGVVAAAGIIALTDHVERLADDHANARRLAEGLAGVDGIEVDPDRVQTNMVFADLGGTDTAWFQQAMAAEGVRVLTGRPLRLVTHLDVSTADVDHAVEAAGRVMRSR
ncbi:MAG: low-specificity L-threonine aldolase [Actinomycetota bacterium]|nr:low-specificity L-threonine aldolase [Actinomycetota bacterium]